MLFQGPFKSISQNAESSSHLVCNIVIISDFFSNTHVLLYHDIFLLAFSQLCISITL